MSSHEMNSHAAPKPRMPNTGRNDITVHFEMELPKVGTWQGYTGKAMSVGHELFSTPYTWFITIAKGEKALTFLLITVCKAITLRGKIEA